MNSKQDFTFIGAGIMSATLGVLIKQLIPDANIRIYERLDKVGAESSDAWNNAGTGHSAFCELNYTPEDDNGDIDITKALKISEQFEISKQLWAFLIRKKIIKTDVNFGALTRSMIAYLGNCEGVEIHLGHQVEDINKCDDGSWEIEIKDLHSGIEKTIETNFVFIGAGGGALKLLEKSKIPEGEGYGGFPVSGQFLKCTNPEIIKQHEAKVYGKAEEGSPPMSVPHLDTRILNGERSLLFGPYAGFSTKFLKNGSYFDLPLSIDAHNIFPMLSAGISNVSLTKYLIEQVMQSPEERFEALVKYYPEAKFEDWELITAGQRVQIIKKDEKEGGVLKFGTEIVTNKDKNLAALLGASPGASTSVSIMLNVLIECFPEQMKSDSWKNKLSEIFPSYGQSLIKDGALCAKIRDYTTSILKLEE